MQKITIIKPDDAHLHLRDHGYLSRTVPDAAQRFGRAIIMPNLKPPVTTLVQAQAYRDRILAAVPPELTFQPLMTLYLTESMRPELIAEAKSSGLITALKLYPAGVTTHSDAGVSQLEKIYPVLAAMEEQQLPLLVHGETNDPQVDIFDREKYFLEDMQRIQQRFPQLRMVLEHITTKDAVDYVSSAGDNLAATLTVHHLLLNRNDLLAGGIRPHYYCLPVLKRRSHQESLLKAAVSGNPKFFLGTDSAPHAVHTKESPCGCAGVYSAHAAIELYAEVFDSLGCIQQLENFASRFAADFYGLPYNQEKITLLKRPWRVTKELDFGDEKLIPLRGGDEIGWAMETFAS